MIAEIIMEDEELMALALEITKQEEELLKRVFKKIIDQKLDGLMEDPKARLEAE